MQYLLFGPRGKCENVYNATRQCVVALSMHFACDLVLCRERARRQRVQSNDT